ASPRQPAARPDPPGGGSHPSSASALPVTLRGDVPNGRRRAVDEGVVAIEPLVRPCRACQSDGGAGDDDGERHRPCDRHGSSITRFGLQDHETSQYHYSAETGNDVAKAEGD